jgi:hypothetical protein
MEFLGHPMMYWIELEKRLSEDPDSVRSSKLLQEVVDLRGLVDFYESRAAEMYSQRRQRASE